MAQRATGFAKKAPTARGERVGMAPQASSGSVQNAIPLKLAALLTPYRRHGRLSLRVERMPQLARLSAGRNNGNNSWSLASDELDDLFYLPPEGDFEPHSIAVRVIGIEEGGATLALIDYPIEPATAQDTAQDQEYLRQLSDELAKVKAALAARESELEQRKRERSNPAAMRDAIDAELTSARAAWKLELDERLATATAEAAAKLDSEKEAWLKEHSQRLTLSEERTQARIVEARERWRQEAKSALVQAESVWRAEEAARFAEAEAQWRRKLTTAEARTKNQPETSADREREFAELRAQIAERDTALAQSRTSAEQAKQRWRQDTEAALANAEATWRAGEAARLAAAQESSRQQSDKALAEWKARCEQAEASLARRAEAAAKHSESDDKKLAELRKALDTAQAKIAAQDAALAQARSDATIVSERDSISLKLLREELLAAHAKVSEYEAVLAKGGKRPAADAAAREAELSSLREELSAVRKELGTAKAKLADREAALAEAARRPAVDAAAPAREAELSSLRGDLSAARKELGTAQGKLAERESALAEARRRADTADSGVAARESEFRSTRAELSGVRAELSGLRKELGTVQAKLAERETALAEARRRADAADSGVAARESELRSARAELSGVREELSGLRKELGTAHAKLAERESALTDARSRADTADNGVAAREIELRSARAELSGVREELAGLRGALAARDADLAAERAKTSAVVDTSERDNLRSVLNDTQTKLAEREARLRHLETSGEEMLQAARLNYELMLEDAKKMWKAEEATRFAAAEARGREESAAEEQSSKIRAEAAEAALAQLRMRAERNQGEEHNAAGLKEELASVQAELAERETELAYARSMLESNGLLAPGSDLQTLAQSGGGKQPSWAGGLGGMRIIFELSLVTVLAVAAFVYFPRAISVLPYSWQENISDALGGAPAAAPAKAPAAKPKAAAPVVLVTHSANLRTAPSGKAAVAATIPRGTKVSPVEHKGNWTRVTIAGTKQQGWVYTAYLASASEAVPAKPVHKKPLH